MGTVAFDRENTKFVTFKFNNRTDADIIAHLAKQTNRQAYIKQLIRADIAAHAAETVESAPAESQTERSNKMYHDYHITADSFGSNCPGNWEEIAAFLNGLIDEHLNNAADAFEPGYDDTGLSTEGHEIVDHIWSLYCAGEIEDAPAPEESPAE